MCKILQLNIYKRINYNSKIKLAQTEKKSPGQGQQYKDAKINNHFLLFLSSKIPEKLPRSRLLTSSCTLYFYYGFRISLLDFCTIYIPIFFIFFFSLTMSSIFIILFYLSPNFIGILCSYSSIAQFISFYFNYFRSFFFSSFIFDEFLSSFFILV